MSTPLDFKETLKQQADIVRVVGDYVKLKKAGAQNFSGLCPFHSEKTPSFNVHATRQFFHCFGCGTSGDVFTFIQKIENISFPEAVRLIAQRMDIPLPKLSFGSPEEARDARHRTALLEIQEAACDFFQACLKRADGAEARQYLKGRDLDVGTIARFRIGYAPDSGFLLRDYFKGKYEGEVLRESGLFSWKTPEEKADKETQDPSTRADALARDDTGKTAIYAKFRNRVMFPITNENGRVIAFTGRRLSSDEKSGPKYLNSPETPIYSKSRVLFNLDLAKEAIRKLNYSILVEGQMDCISVFAAGFHNVIASSGTAFTGAQAKLLARFSKNIVVNFDPDTAGANATERTLALLVEEDFNIKVLRLEAGFDPDLFIRRRGKDAYAEALSQSQRYFDYLIERARGQFPVRSAEGKVKAVNYLLPHIQRIPSRIVRDELAHEIAQKLAIDSAVLRQELKHVAGSRSAATVKAPADVQVTDAERILIRALASAGQIQAGEEHLSARDGAEEQFDPALQAQFVLKAERLHEGLASESLLEALLNSAPRPSDVLEVAVSDDDRRLLALILMRDEEDLTPEQLEGAVRALRRIALRRKLEQVQRELQASRGKQSEVLQALLQEKVRLKRALMDPGLAEDGPAARSP
jgi:DNA primase